MRKIRKLLLFISLSALVFISFSCEDSSLEGTYEISIDLPEGQSEVSFAQKGGSETILLTANNKWQANVSNLEDEQWVTINIKEGGEGEKQEIIITTLENPEKKGRESEIIILCGNKPMKISIKQAQLSDIVIQEAQKELIFTKSTPSVEVVIDTNLDVEIEITTEITTQEQWLFCVPTPDAAPTTKGLKQKSFTITTTTNYGDQRKGEVIFKNAETGDKSVIAVTQAKENAVFIRSEDEHELKYNGITPVEVLLDANAEITTTITYSEQDATPQKDWLSVAPKASSTKALVAKTFSFTATENPLATDRTATIRFTNATDKTVYDEVSIIQLRRGTIVIDNPTPSPIDKTLQDYKVIVKSTDIEGVDVVISDITEGADANWITYNKEVPPVAVEGKEGTYTYTFQVKFNEITDTRSAKITFKDINDANIAADITVSQSGKGIVEITTPSTPTQAITGEVQEYKVTVSSTSVDEIDVIIADITQGADPDWITYNNTITPINGVYTFQVKRNGLTERAATITFKDKNDASVSDAITVTQAIKVDKLEIDLTFPNSNWNQDTNNSIYANPFLAVDYKFEINTDMAWNVEGNTAEFVTVTESGASAATNKVITVNVPANTASSTSAEREVILTFTSGNKTIKVKIIQKDSKVNVAYNLGSGTLQETIEDISSYYTNLTITNLTITGEKVLQGADFLYMKGITTLTDLDISGSMVANADKIIPDGAFENHPSLARVKLYASLEGRDTRLIGARAFKNCILLESIDLNIPGLTSLGTEAFFNCAVLTTVTLPSTFKTFGQKTFRSCESLTSITINTSVPPTINSGKSTSTCSFGDAATATNNNLKFYVPATSRSTYLKVTTKNLGWNDGTAGNINYSARIV